MPFPFCVFCLFCGKIPVSVSSVSSCKSPFAALPRNGGGLTLRIQGVNLRIALRIKSMELPSFIVNLTDVRMFWREGPSFAPPLWRAGG